MPPLPRGLPWGLVPRFRRRLALERIRDLPSAVAVGVLELPAWQPTPHLRAQRARADELTSEHDAAALRTLLGLTVGSAASVTVAEGDGSAALPPELGGFLTGACTVLTQVFGAGVPGSAPPSAPSARATPSLDLPNRFEWTARDAPGVTSRPHSIRWPPWLTRDAARLLSPAVVCALEGARRLAVLDRAAASQGGAAPAAGAAPVAPAPPGTSRLLSVVDARVVCASAVWDGTADAGDVGNGRAEARELGHCVSLYTQRAHLRFVDRFATLYRELEAWLPVHVRDPPHRVFGRVTVAFTCREEADGARVGAPRPAGWRGNREGADDAAAVHDAAAVAAVAAAAAGGSAGPVAAGADAAAAGAAGELLTVHTLTFEALVRTAGPALRSLLLRRVLPAPFEVAVGWTVVDVDGHFASTGGRDVVPVALPDELLPRPGGGALAGAAPTRDHGVFLLDITGTGSGGDVPWPAAFTHPAVTQLRDAAAVIARDAGDAAVAAAVDRARELAPYFEATAAHAAAWTTALRDIADAAEACGCGDALLRSAADSGGPGGGVPAAGAPGAELHPHAQLPLAMGVLRLLGECAGVLARASEPGWTPWAARLAAECEWEAAADAAESAAARGAPASAAAPLPPPPSAASPLPDTAALADAMAAIASVTGAPPSRMGALYLRGRSRVAATWDEMHVRQSDMGVLLAAAPFAVARSVVEGVLDRVAAGIAAAAATAGRDVDATLVDRVHRLRQRVPVPGGAVDAAATARGVVGQEPPEGGAPDDEGASADDGDVARLRRLTAAVPPFAVAVRSLLVDVAAAGVLPRSRVSSVESAAAVDSTDAEPTPATEAVPLAPASRGRGAHAVEGASAAPDGDEVPTVRVHGAPK